MSIKVVPLAVIANTILKKVYERNVTVDPVRLRFTTYIAMSVYFKMKEDSMRIMEPFIVGDNGPTSGSIDFALQYLKDNEPIVDYPALINKQKTKKTVVTLIDGDADPELNYSINKAMLKTMNVDIDTIVETITGDDGAWKKSLNNKSIIIDPHDVLNDDTCLALLN